MSSRRIVVVMLEPPLPFGNAAARWYYVLLRGLVDRGYRVTAFAACSKPEQIDEARRLFPAPQYDLRLYPFPRPSLARKLRNLLRPYGYMFGPEIERDLKAELAKGFDLLHLEQLWSGWLAIKHADKALVNIHFLAALDLPTLRPKSIRQAFDIGRQLAAERWMLRRFRRFRALSEPLAVELRRLNPSASVEVVPLGIDTSLYDFIPDDQRPGEPIISLIGSMNWYPGFSAAKRLLERLWPEIKRRCPAARARIIGWAARSALAEFVSLPDVEIFENVPDTRPYFQQSGILLYAPERGSGMKIKVMEAMAYGIPVVTTRDGVEGIPAVDGLHAQVAETDAELIERAVALLNDPERQNTQRGLARLMLEAECGPAATLDGLERIYGSLWNR
jgi:glycosyltransferase involved in cell wall biosynthesis